MVKVNCALAFCLAWLSTAASGHDLAPSKEAALRRAPQIFNAVHDALRQWGSSMHHNGMSLFLVTVPTGVLLHHGNARRESPSEPDWLAFEIEHAEMFARGVDRPRHARPPPLPPPPGQKPLADEEEEEEKQQQQQQQYGDGPAANDSRSGYLHVYRTKRPLHYLYVDGMGGGKTTIGTLDTQDLLLRGDRSTSGGNGNGSSSSSETPGSHHVSGSGPLNERQRAEDLCKLCRAWNLQGVMRMEAGFEIIQCDFSDGLHQVQALRRPPAAKRSLRRLVHSEYLRGVAERYDGIGSSRALIDFSHMVSAFFFPVNLTNPNPGRPDLPRLSEATDEELAAIKSFLEDVIQQQQRQGDTQSPITWQGVSDMIVSRYATRLEFMIQKIDELEHMTAEINVLLDVYVDQTEEDAAPSIPDAVERCTTFYLQSISPASEIDHLIYAAFHAVTATICNKLFHVRDLIHSAGASRVSVLSKAKYELQSLVDFLDWAHFKRCSKCDLGEVCVIPMWPFGTAEDYFHPRCGHFWDVPGKRYWDE